MALNGPDTTDRQPPAPTSSLMPPTGPSRRLVVLLAVLAVAGLIGSIGFGAAWNGARHRDDAQLAMKATARDFLGALTNFDAKTVDADFARIVAFATGDFRKQADQFFGSDVRKALKERQASSRGEIRDLFVQSFGRGQGRVFAVIDQTIANNQFPTPEADELRVEIGLTRSGGAWRVFDVRVLQAPPARVAPALGAPSSGTTTTTR